MSNMYGRCLIVICFTAFVASCGGGGSSSSSANPSPSVLQTTVGPAVSNTTDTSTTLQVATNADATGYYLIQPAEEPIAQVKAVLGGTSFEMKTEVVSTVNLTGLNMGTKYVIYFVARDKFGNSQPNVQSVDIMTAVPLPVTK